MRPHSSFIYKSVYKSLTMKGAAYDRQRIALKSDYICMAGSAEEKHSLVRQTVSGSLGSNLISWHTHFSLDEAHVHRAGTFLSNKLANQ